MWLMVCVLLWGPAPGGHGSGLRGGSPEEAAGGGGSVRGGPLPLHLHPGPGPKDPRPPPTHQELRSLGG